MKREIEIEDTLQECVDSATDDVREELLRYLKDNPDTDTCPDLSDIDDAVHEIVDSAVPIYTAEIEAAWYLYGSKLEAAYENAGVGDDSRQNNGMAAIYYYIMEQVADWWETTADDVFEEWHEPPE